MAADPDAAVKAQIAGALRNCIDAHGPIDKSLISSATKRILRQLQSEGYLFDGRRIAEDAMYLQEPIECFVCGTPTHRLDIHYAAPFCNSEACKQAIENDLRRRNHGE